MIPYSNKTQFWTGNGTNQALGKSFIYLNKIFANLGGPKIPCFLDKIWKFRPQCGDGVSETFDVMQHNRIDFFKNLIPFVFKKVFYMFFALHILGVKSSFSEKTTKL